MQITVSYHEIISWIVAAISLALFFYERKKNNLTPFYMNLQGILKSCHSKAMFYWMVAKNVEVENNTANRNDIIRWQGVSNDFDALKQIVMGVMKAIEPNKDMPFDERDYTSIKERIREASTQKPKAE